VHDLIVCLKKCVYRFFFHKRLATLGVDDLRGDVFDRALVAFKKSRASKLFDPEENEVRVEPGSSIVSCAR